MTTVAPTPSEGSPQPALPRLDGRLIQWLAVQTVQDARARLVEGGAGPDAHIELASVFVDLSVTVRGERERRGAEDALVIRHVCGEPTNEEAAGLGGDLGPTSRGRGRGRWLLVGGPGSGKSTTTTMVAQLLRGPWLADQRGELPAELAAQVPPVAQRLDDLAGRLRVQVQRGVLPMRVNLPSLAQWLVSQSDDDSSALLWRYLAARMAADVGTFGLTSDVTEAYLEAMIGAAGQVLWVFDGLDEVPRTAGRDKVVSVIRAGLSSAALGAPGLLVTTRPQGYEGELDDLATMVLEPMPVEQARDYGERLLRAWAGHGPDFAARREALHAEFGRPEIQALVQTPLHTTMAALLVAMEGSLPRSRWMLFDHYFGTIFKRELSKPGQHNFRAEDGATLRELHARAGLVLHVRAQSQAGTRPALLRRELREELAAIFREKGHAEEDVVENAERMMRFATERLVLLLHASTGEYSFGIRSLQEFFAAEALLRGGPAHVRRRLDAIALDPHWSNVLALVASKCALTDGGQTRPTSLDYTEGLCRALNEGTVGGEAARLCSLGSRLALAMLRETEHYGDPWLHEPLWSIALAAAASPVQLQIRRRAFARAYAAHLHPSTPTIWNDDVEVHMRLGVVAANWAGHGKKARRAAAASAAQGLLKSGAADRRLAGWLLLYGSLVADDPDALRIAEEHAPADRDDARGLVDALLERRAPRFPALAVPTWLVRFVRAHVGWFTPPWLPEKPFLSPTLWGVSPFDVAAQIPALRKGRFIQLKVAGNQYFILARSIDQDNPSWSDTLARLPREGAEWKIWQTLVSFHAAPSHLGLAEVLDTAAEASAFEEVERSLECWAWPVVACLKFVDRPERLRALATRARRGDLGTVDDWLAAENRWHRDPHVPEEEVAEWLSAGLSAWGPGLAERGIVLGGEPSFHYGRQPTAGQLLNLWDRLLRQIATDPRRSAHALQLLPRVLRKATHPTLGSARSELVPLAVAAKAEEIEPRRAGRRLLFCIDLLLPDLDGPDAEGWFALLDERGRRRATEWDDDHSEHEAVRHRHRQIADALVRRLQERPEQWGLLDPLLVMLAAAPETDVSKVPELELPADAPPELPATAAFLRLLGGPRDAPERARLVRRFLEAPGPERSSFYGLATEVLARRDRDADRARQTLAAALDASAPEHPARDLLMGALFERLPRAAPPVFASPEAWADHALPGPFFSGQEPERPPPRLVGLVELSNLRLFKDTPAVDKPFPAPSANSGQWILLTGENGVGKTTLLRALALALAPHAVASKLLDERLPMIRNGGEARVEIEVDADRLSAVVRYKERTETVEAGGKEAENVRRPWVVGYGVRRGNARGEPDRQTEWGPTAELHTLFDRPASLVNATDWLIELEGQMLREERQQAKERGRTNGGSRAAIWRAVVQALKTVLAVTDIEPEDKHVLVQHPQFGRVRLDALSDGYLTTTGWVIDLIARWVDRKRVLDEPVGPDVLRRMTGFVLIDEIDLHLHPIWQLRIVDDMRRLFPRLSFVVTTHNPLTLQGARPGEVYVMRREGARIELVQRDIQPGYNVDRVLLEQFGIGHTFDKGTRELLQRHRELLERGAQLGDPERARVEAALVERLGGVGEIVRAERRGAADPLAADEQHLLTPFLKKRA